MPSTKELVTFVQRIEAGDEVKIEYSHPWFWKVRKNNAKRRGRSAGPRMLLSEEDVEEIKSHQKAFREKRDGPEAEAVVNDGENSMKTHKKQKTKNTKKGGQPQNVWMPEWIQGGALKMLWLCLVGSNPTPDIFYCIFIQDSCIMSPVVPIKNWNAMGVLSFMSVNLLLQQQQTRNLD